MRPLFLFSFLAFCLVFTGLQAQGLKAGSFDAEADLPKALLWEIRGKGLKKPCYLFGTIHLIQADKFVLKPKTLEALKKTKAVFFELDMSEMMAMSIQMMQLAPMKGQTLKGLLEAEDYEMVKAFFTSESSSQEAKALPFSMYENWQPILLQSFLYADMMEGPSKSYEMELLALAQKQKKRIGGLETIEDQITALASMSYLEQAKTLAKTIQELKQNPSEARKGFEDLMRLYVEADLEGMIRAAQEDEQLREGEDELLTKRNQRWIPKIIEQSKKEPSFFAVGAAHLGGANGVIRLLIAEGYELIPIE